MNQQSLIERWEALKSEDPKLRIRNAAQQLGVSEAELVALGDQNIRLTDDFQEQLKEVEKLGKVLAITRNDDCVHERKGVYHKVSFKGQMGLAVNPDIDLRLFMHAWKYAFAVREGGRDSIQYFGKDGEAIHKIYLLEESDVVAYQTFVSKYKDSIAAPLTIEPSAAPKEEHPDDEIDTEGFQQAWLNLQDTHDFHGLTNQYKVVRLQALRLAPQGYAYTINVQDIQHILGKVAENDSEIMVFVSSKGCIQIHTGHARKQVVMGPWFNILDPDFNLHLRMDKIASAWIVKKPTKDGIVTSIETFDKNGNMIVQFFGKRKPGIPEREDWREAVASVALQQV